MATMDEAQYLRRALDRIETRRGRCVPPELKARARKWIAEQRAEGRTVSEVATELGVAAGTILRWSNGGVRSLVPVRVVPDEILKAVVVVSPSGLRIEGLTLADAVRVLRELG
jgi:predicted transcriptional regulator